LSNSEKNGKIVDLSNNNLVYLRAFNIFAVKVSGGVKLVAPRFVRDQVADIFKFDEGAEKSFLSQFIKSSLPMETLTLNSAIELPETYKRIDGRKFVRWENVGPISHPNGKLSAEKIAKGVSYRSFRQIRGNIKSTSVAYFLDLLPENDALCMGDRSSSADVIFKCGDKTVIEVAVKNELGAFKVAQVQRELNKSVVSLCSLRVCQIIWCE
jgi:hypothetical protein